MRGKEQDTVTEVAAGDIAAVAKLERPRDRRRARGQGNEHRRRRRSRCPSPCSRSRSTPSRRPTRTSSPTRCTACRTRIRCCASSANPETHQTLLRGMGETHLSIALEKLARKFGVEVESEDVRVAYRETIAGEAEAEGKIKKQTRRPRAVRGRVASGRADRARRGHRVRRQDRRRRDPPATTSPRSRRA